MLYNSQARNRAAAFSLDDAILEPFTTIAGEEGSPLLLLCDHARNAVPRSLGTLGLPPGELERHIAYDIGAAPLTRLLAERLGASAVLSGFSRLLIDPNRGADDPTLIMRLSDGAIIPANASLDEAGHCRRMDEYYWPYHHAIDRVLDGMLDAGATPVVLSIHSFTPNWKGVPRPWHAALLWDRDPRLSQALISALRAEPGLVVGDNEPYSGGLEGDTMNVHCTRRGLSHALIEVRQDLIADAPGVSEWADRLARILPALLNNTTISERLDP